MNLKTRLIHWPYVKHTSWAQQTQDGTKLDRRRGCVALLIAADWVRIPSSTRRDSRREDWFPIVSEGVAPADSGSQFGWP